MEYEKFFNPQTLTKLNKKSAENLKTMLGDKTLMQTLMSSQNLLNQISKIEAPYKDKLEKLAVQMVKELYPIIDEEGIVIDAKLGSISDVNKSLDEIKITPQQLYKVIYREDMDIFESISPESRRRIVNSITQGAALRGAFAFYLFKEHLDKIDPTLVSKYGQIMKEVFGIYDDPNAIAMFLSALAQGHKIGGGSSKVIVKEVKIQDPNKILRPGAKYQIWDENQKVWRHNFIYKRQTPEGKHVFSHYGGEYSGSDTEELLQKGLIKIDDEKVDEVKINQPLNYQEIWDECWDEALAEIGEYEKDEGEDDGDLWNEEEVSELAHTLFKEKTGIEYSSVAQLREQNSTPNITIKARAICFPMLVHEIIKGLYELVSLQSFKGDKASNQKVVDKVDLLKHEPHDMKYGKFIYDALNEVFANSKYGDNAKIREFFFVEIYKLENDDFISFIENAINESLTSEQKRWVDNTLKQIDSDLKADNYDQTKIDEIKINAPSIETTRKKIEKRIDSFSLLDIKIGKYDVSKGRQGIEVPFDSKAISTMTKERVKKVFNKLGIKPEKTWVGWLKKESSRFDNSKISLKSTFVLSHYKGEPILFAQTQTLSPNAGQAYLYSQYAKSGKSLRLPSQQDIEQKTNPDDWNIFADSEECSKEDILRGLKIPQEQNEIRISEPSKPYLDFKVGDKVKYDDSTNFNLTREGTILKIRLWQRKGFPDGANWKYVGTNLKNINKADFITFDINTQPQHPQMTNQILKHYFTPETEYERKSNEDLKTMKKIDNINEITLLEDSNMGVPKGTYLILENNEMYKLQDPKTKNIYYLDKSRLDEVKIK